MYRSLYNYKGEGKGTLPVRKEEQFTFIKQHDANWWKMRSQTGSVGLVPACYLEPVHSDTVRGSLQGPFKETVVCCFVGMLLKMNW